jgi:hypothetical protein
MAAARQHHHHMASRPMYSYTTASSAVIRAPITCYIPQHQEQAELLKTANISLPLCTAHNPALALSREGDPDSAMHQVASSTCGPERSQVRIGLPAIHCGSLRRAPCEPDF